MNLCFVRGLGSVFALELVIFRASESVLGMSELEKTVGQVFPSDVAGESLCHAASAGKSRGGKLGSSRRSSFPRTLLQTPMSKVLLPV